MAFTDIPIDLDVYKALEMRRISFGEPHNAILRRILGITALATVESIPERAMLPERERAMRSSGDYEVTILGKTKKVRSLREALSTALLDVEASQLGFLEKLTRRPTTRGRRIVARTPEQIYPRNPQLVPHAARLSGEWYFDTNISRKACERYLVTIGQVANIETPQLT
jgi:hypothetical protein